MNPNFVQFITIGITNVELNGADKKYIKCLPVNNGIDISQIRDLYNERIFNFENRESARHLYKQIAIIKNNWILHRNASEEIKISFQAALNNCSGYGKNPWVINIIDYYGPGFILKDGLKE